MSKPNVTDYLKLFRLYGDDLTSIYMDSDDLRYKLLFEQIIALLLEQSDFNDSIPQPFKDTARSYSSGHEGTLKHFTDPGNRNFMMSDLHDFVVLKAKMAGVEDLGETFQVQP